jgi:hypothetical protein
MERRDFLLGAARMTVLAAAMPGNPQNPDGDPVLVRNVRHREGARTGRIKPRLLRGQRLRTDRPARRTLSPTTASDRVVSLGPNSQYRRTDP